MGDRPASRALIPLAIVAAAGAVTASAALSSEFALDASRVMSGELWRLFTGHLAHLSWRHYVVDALAYWLLFTSYAAWRGSLAATGLTLTASVAVSVTVVALGQHPVYGGLSGLSCAAFAALVLAMLLERPRDVRACVLAAAFGVYLGFGEGGAAGIPVASEAHWSGALTGVLFEFIRFRVTHPSGRRQGVPAAPSGTGAQP